MLSNPLYTTLKKTKGVTFKIFKNNWIAKNEETKTQIWNRI